MGENDRITAKTIGAGIGLYIRDVLLSFCRGFGLVLGGIAVLKLLGLLG